MFHFSLWVVLSIFATPFAWGARFDPVFPNFRLHENCDRVLLNYIDSISSERDLFDDEKAPLLLSLEELNDRDHSRIVDELHMASLDDRIQIESLMKRIRYRSAVVIEQTALPASKARICASKILKDEVDHATRLKVIDDLHFELGIDSETARYWVQRAFNLKSFRRKPKLKLNFADLRKDLSKAE